MFPGMAHLDGSIEGAMLCGMDAYTALKRDGRYRAHPLALR
tara:strand:- start:52 stop:174 length:123 start_codon:yes stop_codon:yes gene_type:complete